MKASKTPYTTVRRSVLFVGIEVNGESASDATTPLKFRHLLEEKGLTQKISKRSTRTWRPRDC